MENKDQVSGVYAIPVTPFTDQGVLDEVSLQRCVRFCLAAKVHGIVGPVNASESIALTDHERLAVAEILVQEAKDRVPVIIGVSGVSTTAAVQFAAHAARIGADAVIAMPPYVRHAGPAEIVEFYAAVATAAAGLPVWIQNYVAPIGTPMAAELVARLLREIPGVNYLKEETAYAPQMMTQIAELAGDALHGIMGGMAARFLLEEVRRGAIGTMPACEVADAHVAVWQAIAAGDASEARRRHNQLLPLLNFEAMYSFSVYKEVLWRRGIIASPRTRMPGAGKLDVENQHELDLLLEDIAPLLTLGHCPTLADA